MHVGTYELYIYIHIKTISNTIYLKKYFKKHLESYFKYNNERYTFEEVCTVHTYHIDS